MMKFEKPQLLISKFDVDDIITTSTGGNSGNDPKAQTVFKAAGRDDVNVTGSVNVGEMFN